MTHILYISDNYLPELNAPSSRVSEHSENWVKSGNKVTVITCAPNFPGGRVFNGYKNRLWSIEKINGVNVIRVWSFIAKNEGLYLRTIDFLSFMFTASIAGLFVRKVDVVIGTSPQFFTLIAAWFIAKFRRKILFVEIRDLWPDSISAVGVLRNSLILKVLSLMEYFLYRVSNGIIVLTQSFRDVMIARGVNPNKIHVITNGVNLDFFKPIEVDSQYKKKLLNGRQFLVGYVGTHGYAHQLETIIDLAKKCQDTNQSITFIFFGNGARKPFLIRYAKKLGLKNLFFHDQLDKKEMRKILSLLDVSVVHLSNNPVFEKVIPSKIFELMAMGVPILAGISGEGEQLIVDNKCGVCVSPNDLDALYKELLLLKSDVIKTDKMKINALTSSHKYNRTILAQQLLKLLEEKLI